MHWKTRAVALAMGVCGGMLGNPRLVAGGWNAGVQKKGQDSIVYQLWVPSGYTAANSYPLVVTLHGVGERGTDNNKQVTFFQLTSQFTNGPAQTRNPCFVLAPQCSPKDMWVNTPYSQGTYKQDAIPISTSLSLAVAALDSVMNRYSIDKTRLYVVGLSMGGYGAWDLLTRYPTRFAAGSASCGAGDTSKAKLIAKVPTWTFHTKDDAVVPFAGSQQMVNALVAAGGSPKYTWHETGGHDAWIWAYSDTSLSNWLFRQKNASTHVGLEPASLARATGAEPVRLVGINTRSGSLRAVGIRAKGSVVKLDGRRE